VADSEKAIAFVVDNWDSLGVEEHGGVLLLPVTIKRRNKTGGYDETPVMLRNVTNDHRFKCRATAREYAARCKLDLDRDAELVDEIENYAINTCRALASCSHATTCNRWRKCGGAITPGSRRSIRASATSMKTSSGTASRGSRRRRTPVF
jgi:hypothetical protein